MIVGSWVDSGRGVAATLSRVWGKKFFPVTATTWEARYIAETRCSPRRWAWAVKEDATVSRTVKSKFLSLTLHSPPTFLSCQDLITACSLLWNLGSFTLRWQAAVELSSTSIFITPPSKASNHIFQWVHVGIQSYREQGRILRDTTSQQLLYQIVQPCAHFLITLSKNNNWNHLNTQPARRYNRIPWPMVLTAIKASSKINKLLLP